MGETVETGTVGGGAATPVGNEFAQFLQGLLETGEFGTTGTRTGAEQAELDQLLRRRDELSGNRLAQRTGALESIEGRIRELESQQQRVGQGAVDQTGGIAEALNAIIQGPDVSGTQSAVQEVIQRQSDRDVADLRERFTAGGGSQGTPSAVAEALFRSETAPRLAAATGQLDLAASQQQIQALIPILQVLSQFSGRGVPQAAPFVEVKEGPLQTIAGLGTGAGSVISGLRQ
ncbi:MAG: hypothetical protein ACYSW3_26000 [Planctomycetota bacterium]|jgi:hypothetical protein